MIDPRRIPTLVDHLVGRLTTEHGGTVERERFDAELPAGLVMVTIGELLLYVQPDPGNPSTGRPPEPDTVLLSACVATEVVDTGTSDAVLYAFLDDPATPADLRLFTTGFERVQVWIDRPVPATVSIEVADALLDDFMHHAGRLRASIAAIDLDTSAEARERAEMGGFTEPVSYDTIDDYEWGQHPWLSQLTWNSDMDGNRHFCLYDLQADAAESLGRITLEFERVDGTWEAVTPEIPGPMMPARSWVRPSVAWWDKSQWSPRDGRPDSPTGKWRARIPTGWVGPPL